MKNKKDVEKYKKRNILQLKKLIEKRRTAWI